MEICLEITHIQLLQNTLTIFFDALKTVQNEKSYIFQEIGIPEIHVRLFENFQNLIALQVLCLASTKDYEWLPNGTVLGQNSLNSSGGKIRKKS